MSANSVLPPLDGIARACSSEYFAGTILKELSECQRRLPSEKSRARLSRPNTWLLTSRFDTSAQAVGSRRVRLARAGADGVLDLAQAAREGELLLVGERLVVEDQYRVPIHARVH